MKLPPNKIRDPIVTLLILAAGFGLSVLMQDVFNITEHITTVFVFAVFLVSLCTDGFFYGIAASFLATVAVNYAFTFPYFALNFTIPGNFFSAVVMILLSVLTSALTTQVKHQKAIQAESQRERMRADLMRAVSHDLRTPLTTIYGSSTVLLENSPNLTDQQRQQILRGIREDAQWLTRIVENLLSITRINSGSVKLIKTPTVLDEVIDSVILKFRKRYAHQQVTLSLPEEILVVPMDPILMEQVLLNLLENAVQHAAGMTELRLSVTQAENQAILSVADNGQGIPADRLERIFSGTLEHDSQHMDAHKRNAGIGLSVCAAIVRAHGGSISAENRPQGGMEFRISLNTEVIDDE